MRMSLPGAVKLILSCVSAIGVEVNINSIVSHPIVFDYAIRVMSCAAARATPRAQRESGARSTPRCHLLFICYFRARGRFNAQSRPVVWSSGLIHDTKSVQSRRHATHSNSAWILGGHESRNKDNLYTECTSQFARIRHRSWVHILAQPSSKSCAADIKSGTESGAVLWPRIWGRFQARTLNE